MFIQNCFILKNTPKLRKQIEKIGYYKIRKQANLYPHLQTITKYSQFYDCMFQDEEIKFFGEEKGCCGINCGDNEALFLAIAALNDETDYMQWFVTEVDQQWINQGTFAKKGSLFICLAKHLYPECKSKEFCSTVVPCHKATIAELITNRYNLKIFTEDEI